MQLCWPTTGDMTLASLQLPNFVRPIKWASQNDILADANVRAFVTHGGAHSLYEAAYHATPVVVLPVAGDQTHNAVKVKLYHGLTMPMK